MAAVLVCGPGAALSHRSAAWVWRLVRALGRVIDISMPAHRRSRRPEIRVHRRVDSVLADTAIVNGLPVTGVVQTLIDLARELSRGQLEAAINEADRLDLIDPESLRVALGERRGLTGLPALRTTLDRRTFVLTRSELERRFLPLARRTGLPKPVTQLHLNGWDVDFYWPKLRLVIETDGLRYHRTAAQQARDRVRDQAHQAAGDYPLRFTHAQIRYEPAYVARILSAVVRNLKGDSAGF